MISVARQKKLLKEFHLFALSKWIYNKDYCNKIFFFGGGKIQPIRNIV